MDIVIFGVTGDLAQTKLIPALQSLGLDDLRIIGFARSEQKNHPQIVGSYDSVHDFRRLKEMLRPDKAHFFYLAIPPSLYKGVLATLVEADLVEGSRVFIEKPFGESLQDAYDLIDFIHKNFKEGQCLKVDHYLGKEELRTLHIENMQDVSSVEFEILETKDVENRKGFYDKVGALRDVGQNHLLSMLATFYANAKQNREDVLKRLVVDQDSSKYIFAGYQGYTARETFFSVPVLLQSFIDGVNEQTITLRGGKALSENRASITISYKNGEKKIITLGGGLTAYQHIFREGIKGNLASFLSDEEVICAWKFIEEVEKIKARVPFGLYEKGSFVNIIR